MELKNFSILKTRSLRSGLIATLFSLFILHPVWADDTEIFFSSASKANVQPNILFVLDASGSMAFYDCEAGGIKWGAPCDDDTPNGNISRMDRMMTAMQQVIEHASNVNVGLMRFGGTDGGRVIYPVTDIDGNRCSQEVCDQNTIFDTKGTVRSVDDDAIETDTGVVLTTTQQLELAGGSPDEGSFNGGTDVFPELAEGKNATQSSTGWNGVASRAVDGNTSGVYNHGSVTHTANNDSSPWWQVDLEQNHLLSGIKLWNRANHGNRLANFHVFVSETDMQGRSLSDLLADTTVWNFHHQPAVAGGGNLLLSPSATGRFVRIQKVDGGFLSLAEVQVYGASNVAEGKNASQSSTGWNGVASRAVDGNTSGLYGSGSVTHTANQNSPWWQVDLEQNHLLSGIKLWNRADCCGNRLANFHVFVSETDMQGRSLNDLLADTTVWNFHHQPAVAQAGDVLVSTAATGRFVRIQKADSGALSLAEVQVYGTQNDGAGTGSLGAVSAVRFQSLEIPQGATIVDAKISFTAASDESTNTNLTVRVEDVANSEPFVDGTNTISSRSWYANSATWGNVEPWTQGDNYESPDISALIQRIVSKSDWCGGNSLSLSVTGAGSRLANSFDAGNGPVLKVRYRLAGITDTGGCLLTTSKFYMDSFNDDLIETANGTIGGKNDNVLLSDNILTGVQFKNISVPQGAEVKKASIEFTTRDVGTDQNVGADLQADIYMDDSSNPEPLSTNAHNLSDRSKTSTLTWQVPLSANATRVSTRDLSPLVSDMVSKADWSEGNRMIFLMEKTAGAATSLRAFDRFQNIHYRGAVLSISYKTFRASAQQMAGSVREELSRVLEEFVMLDGTSTVGALEESWRYFAGMPLEHGARRTETQFNEERHSRVSHPDTYTGGNLVRSSACSDDDLNSYSCESEAITGNPVYDSPATSECQSSYVVLVTDGRPAWGGTREHYYETVSTLSSLVGGSCSSNYGFFAKCGMELSEYMYETDLNPDLSGKQNVTIHTIGYNHHSDWLSDIATIGGGDYLTASTSDDLYNAVSGVVTNVANDGATFVAPAATIDLFSRISHREDVYLALFQPQSTAKWQGNLKRYNIAGSPPGLKDANKEYAINSNTGTFKPSAQSFWSSAPDGGTIETGGAAEQLDPLVRNVVTYLDPDNKSLLSAGNIISPDNEQISADMFGVNTEYELERLLDWLQGFDLKDEDGDGFNNDPRHHIGDPLHSKPIVVTYQGADGADGEDGETVDAENSESVVYFGTNEGFLHGINTTDGTEKFAFMPSELFGNVPSLFRDRVLVQDENKPYGMDGDITLWIKEDNNNGIVESDSEDKAYLYIGMRRGGKNYYALDVSDKDNPKFLWKIQGGTGDFTELGQSWSKPIMSRIQVNSEVKNILVFGGGYDPLQDDRTQRQADTIGRAIFFVDAETGELIWSGSPADAQTTNLGGYQESFSDMQYSIPSDLTVIHDRTDKLLSQIYVGDMGGRIWRFDVNNGAAPADLVDGGVIADFGQDSNPVGTRRFYHAPDLSLSKKQGNLVLNIAIGSGYQAHPLNSTIEDKFFVFQYPFKKRGPSEYGLKHAVYDVYDPILLSDLYDTTDNLIGEGSTDEVTIAEKALDEKEGWYITMEQNGEKILGKSSTLNSVIRFISYVPTQGTDPCNPSIGESYYWSVNLRDGTPYDPESESNNNPLEKDDRTEKIPSGGLAAPVSVIFVAEENNDINVVDMSGVNSVREWGNAGWTQRKFWAEHPE